MSQSPSTRLVRHNCQFYAIGTKAERIEEVLFLKEFRRAHHKAPKPRFCPLDLSGCGQILVYLSKKKEATEVLDSLMKEDVSLNLEVISL